jgi:hypothetical protein
MFWQNENSRTCNKNKNNVNIIDVVQSYGVILKPVGSLYRGTCPFHDEKDPSFTVYPESESFYCFGCNTGGDAFTFISKMEGISWYEAKKRFDNVSLTEKLNGKKPLDFKRETNYLISKTCLSFLKAHPEKVDQVLPLLKFCDDFLMTHDITYNLGCKLVEKFKEKLYNIM